MQHNLVPVSVMLAIPVTTRISYGAYRIAQPVRDLQPVFPRIDGLMVGRQQPRLSVGHRYPRSVMITFRRAITALIEIARCSRSVALMCAQLPQWLEAVENIGLEALRAPHVRPLDGKLREYRYESRAASLGEST